MRSVLRLEACVAPGSLAAGRAPLRCACVRVDAGGGDFDFLAGNNHLIKDMAGFLLKGSRRGSEAFRPRKAECKSERRNRHHLFGWRQRAPGARPGCVK
jgi:hypothetical protein